MSQMTEKLLVESGVISTSAALGSVIGAVWNETSTATLIGGGLALFGVFLRCATEIWRTMRSDRERIARLKLRLERNGLSVDTDTDE